MKISASIYKQNFGRAFTTEEKKSYASLLKDVRDTLDIKDTNAIIFDFNVPSNEGENVGIGTTWSESMKDFVSFIKEMTGLNSIQLQPQGKIQEGNKSPYSGTTFAYGEHIIDLAKLTTKEYGEILPKKVVEDLDKKYPKNKQNREYRSDYSYVLPAYDRALKLAYKNFKVSPLTAEFEEFKAKSGSWLEKESLFVALTKHYGTSDFTKWDELDKNLFEEATPNDVRQKRIEQIKKDYAQIIDYENFVQFIADKQQKETHQYLNEENIKLYGDCLIGFSQSEMWANKACFRENLFYGGPDPACPETNGIQTWGLPALDYTKLGECSQDGDTSKLGSVGKLLFEKYQEFFSRYDGIRVDAAWQFVTPFIYQINNGNYEYVNLPEINMTIFNIIKAVVKGKATNDSIMLELVGMSADKSRAMTLNTYPHLYTTAYAEYDETPKKFMEKGYERDSFYVGVGCHDNDSLVNLSRDKNKRKMHTDGIKRDYKVSLTDLSTKDSDITEDFRNAKFAEIFSTSKQFFTLPDMFGMEERINISGKTSPNNWSIRIPSDYERFYHSQLSNGYGLNVPKALEGALLMNGFSKNDSLVKKCRQAASILREKGPSTEQEANLAKENGKILNEFVY